MVHAHDLLFNDRPFVQQARDKMRCGANQLHPPFKSLPVGAGAHKGRQKGVVNIDDLIGVLRYELVRKYSHEFGQDDIIEGIQLNFFPELFFKGFLVFSLMCNEHKRNVEPVADILQIRLIADHRLYPGPQGLEMVAGKDIAQAVIFLGYQYDQFLIPGSAADVYGGFFGKRFRQLLAELVIRRLFVGG